MKTKKSLINPKKIPYYLALILLTAGASLILGFLSFGGMYAVAPILPLAFATFGLSVAYEGEIYLQNIKGALNKLFKNNYLKRHLAKEHLAQFPEQIIKKYLLEFLPENADENNESPQFIREYAQQVALLKSLNSGKLDTNGRLVKKQIEKKISDMEQEFILQLFPTQDDVEKQSDDIHELRKWLDSKQIQCPQFYEDYIKQLRLLETFNHKTLDKNSKARKKHIEKTLSDMEKWFSLQLYPTKNDSDEEQSEYTLELREWLADHDQNEWQDQLAKRRKTFHYVKAFSALSAVFMGFGTTYLVVEAFGAISLIPVVMWPMLIVPIAIVAGTAYGLLSYNTITDLINNDTVIKWYKKLRNELRQGLTLRNVFVATMACLLIGLAIALTACTAGTWWTIANNASPLFDWMKRMPRFIMGVINPIITGFSAIFFNIQNSAESLELVDEATQSETNIFQRTYKYITDSYAHLRASENWLQILNPFRILLKLTLTPLRILLFFGHLISIALTSDRMPGIPKIVSQLIAIVSEGFEDAHYFIGHNDENEEPNHQQNLHSMFHERMEQDDAHSHATDIPTRILKTIVLPIYALAALWDYLCSKKNDPATNEQRQVLSFKQAWNKQYGVIDEADVSLPDTAEHPSQNWQVEHAVSLIDKFEKKHLDGIVVGTELAQQKRSELRQLKATLRALPKDAADYADAADSIDNILNAAQENPVYNRHRLFAPANEKTSTQMFVEELPQRVRAMR